MTAPSLFAWCASLGLRWGCWQWHLGGTRRCNGRCCLGEAVGGVGRATDTLASEPPNNKPLLSVMMACRAFPSRFNSTNLALPPHRNWSSLACSLAYLRRWASISAFMPWDGREWVLHRPRKVYGLTDRRSTSLLS
jgi:hypothetical protein